jgi:hypothetical protein
MARTFEVPDDEDAQIWFKGYNLLTAKPTIYAANVSEDDLADDAANNEGVQAVREYAKGEQSEVFVVCAEIEAEISELDDDEKKMFLEDLGLKESGLEKLIKASYKLLGLISYLTAGEQECRAWTITKGTKAPQASKPHIQTLPYRKQTLPRQKPNYGNWNRTIIASNGYLKRNLYPNSNTNKPKLLTTQHKHAIRLYSNKNV